MIQKPIPTNVITGFLGVGKTSLIKRLLKNKPESEVWAVLVNEFGEIGIDAGLIDSSDAKVQIREVAGGCMCCAAGVPMQVAINQLIAKAKPDRLLIEPTGLGHPQEVLRVLTEPHFQNVIAMQACLALVDARKLADKRYTQHEIFNQQLQVADIHLATKSDLYQASELARLQLYLADIGLLDTHALSYSSIKESASELKAIMTLLNGPTQRRSPVSRPSLVTTGFTARAMGPVFDEQLTPDSIDYDSRGIMTRNNQGEGHFSYGWVFEPSYEFKFDAVLELIKRLGVFRVKAVLITDEGIAGFNAVDGELSVTELDDAMDSRIEIIAGSALESKTLEVKLLQASVRLIF